MIELEYEGKIWPQLLDYEHIPFRFTSRQGEDDFTTVTTTKRNNRYPEMVLFRDLLTDLHLVDISIINWKYTWNNRRGERHQIASCLDRFLASEDLVSLDVYYEATILPTLGSDHWPIRIDIDVKDGPKNRTFIFELFWLRDPQFLEKAQQWWESNQILGRNKMHSFQLRLKHLKTEIKRWNKEHFRKIHQDQLRLQEKMKDLQQQMILNGRTEALIIEEGNTLSQLEERRKKEEILWKQKSRIQWLKEGERNTSFFHKKMIQQREHKIIFSLKDQNGN